MLNTAEIRFLQKYIKTGLALAALCLYVACSPKNPVRTDTTLQTPKEPTINVKSDTFPSTDVVVAAPDDVPPPPPPLPVIQVRIEKTACYGNCPIFEIKLFSDGRAEYHGKANTERLGLYEARVTQSFIDLLLAEAEKTGYFQLSDSYPVNGKYLSDLPNTISYIKTDKNEKSILRNHHGPLVLRKFEAFLIERFEALQWELLSSE